jgi:toxin FitB
VTIGELTQWVELRGWGTPRRTELDAWLTSVVELGYEPGVARMWGQLSAAAIRRGRTRPANDMWIAACCLAHGLPLATMNVKDHQDFADHHGLVLV